eukprot:COSAG02_NODE_2177_length_9589_cov_2.871760_9_plen_83_part_00
MDEIADEETQAKPKRQLTQAQLDQLEKAREKANAVRKQNAERKQKEKRLKELQKQVQDDRPEALWRLRSTRRAVVHRGTRVV